MKNMVYNNMDKKFAWQQYLRSKKAIKALKKEFAGLKSQKAASFGINCLLFERHVNDALPRCNSQGIHNSPLKRFFSMPIAKSQLQNGIDIMITSTSPKPRSRAITFSALIVPVLISLLLGSGCSSTGRYSQRYDSAPSQPPSNISQADAIPVYEPYNPANSRSYRIGDKRYHPLQSGLGYTAVGEASWYGEKFHGHLTANGEIYDMYQMSAAHKTLPIPCYARVTNTANNRTIVVRINDRGPFHGDRLLDLSYAAALKLDMVDTGTAPITMAVIHVDQEGQVTVGAEPTPTPPYTSQTAATLATTSAQTLASAGAALASSAAAASNNDSPSRQLFIQVAALQNQRKIAQLDTQLRSQLQVPTQTPQQNGLFRLRLGPLRGETQVEQLLQTLHAIGYEQAYKLYQ